MSGAKCRFESLCKDILVLESVSTNCQVCSPVLIQHLLVRVTLSV